MSRKTLLMFLFLAVVAGGLLAMRLGYAPEIGKFFASEPGLIEQFSGVSWRYSKIFGPADIPLPASVANTDARVKAIYSPSVIRIEGTYWMFFGVSIYCNGWSTARDSIALARSSDGERWQFDRYVIEPNPRSCTAGALSKGDTYQVNDPSAHVMSDGTVAVFYTGVLWHEPSDSAECGVLGLATYDGNLNPISRNDRYFVPTAAHCGESRLGFSRPDLQWESEVTTRLWFDSAFHIKSIPLTSFSTLDDSQVRDEGLVGGDLNTPLLSYGSTVLLINGATINAVVRGDGGSWAQAPLLPSKSGQGWDRDGQGSPDLFIDESTCNVKLYMSGTQLNAADPTGYDALNIGMAVPADNRSFNFPICDAYQAPDVAPIGFFDAASCRGTASGWATDPDSTTPVTVRFFDGPAKNDWTNLLGEVTANVQRGDPVGAHGFEWQVPDALADGTEHRIYAYAYSNETPTVFLQLPQSSENQDPPPAFSCSWSTPVSPEPEVSVEVSVTAEPEVSATTEPGTGGGGGGGATAEVSGDADDDGDVDIFDYSVVVTNFGKAGQGIPGDVDDNGRVDIFDYSLVVTNFGR